MSVGGKMRQSCRHAPLLHFEAAHRDGCGWKRNGEISQALTEHVPCQPETREKAEASCQNRGPPDRKSRFGTFGGFRCTYCTSRPGLFGAPALGPAAPGCNSQRPDFRHSRTATDGGHEGPGGMRPDHSCRGCRQARNHRECWLLAVGFWLLAFSTHSEAVSSLCPRPPQAL